MTPEGKVVALIKKRIKEAGGEVRKCSWENCRERRPACHAPGDSRLD